MKAITLAGALFLSMPGSTAAAPVPAPATPPEANTTLRARLTDEAIKQAVRETLAESGLGPASAPTDGTFSGDSYRAFARGFTEAKKPSCLGPDALKHQPSEISTKHWNIGVSGLLALPFWATAIARGKCN